MGLAGMFRGVVVDFAIVVVVMVVVMVNGQSPSLPVASTFPFKSRRARDPFSHKIIIRGMPDWKFLSRSPPGILPAARTVPHSPTLLVVLHIRLDTFSIYFFP